MQLFRRHLISESLEIQGNRLYLSRPVSSDFEEWRRVREGSQAFLQPWEPTWPQDDLTMIGFRRRLAAYETQWKRGRGYIFFLFGPERSLIGGINLTGVEHGFRRTATLGYWMSSTHAGKGLMQLAVPVLLEFAFRQLKLNRVTAASLPRNGGSTHLLRKLGFKDEGIAREYLEINGKAEDHLMFSILKSEFNTPGLRGDRRPN